MVGDGYTSDSDHFLRLEVDEDESVSSPAGADSLPETPRLASERVRTEDCGLEGSLTYARHGCGQAATFDEVCMPWVYDPDVGPIVAPSAPYAGDGKFRYRPLEGGGTTVELNPNPTPESEFDRRFSVSLQATVAAAREVPHLDRDSHADSSDGDSGDEGSEEEDARESARCASRSRNSAGPRPRTASGGGESTIDPNLPDGWTIERKRRESGRTDLYVHSPEGTIFRSKAEALRSLEAYK